MLYLFLLQNSNVVRLGDPDENFYILQSGKLNVFISGNEGTTSLKIVKPGESVTSLLSFTDVLTVLCCFFISFVWIVFLPRAIRIHIKPFLLRRLKIPLSLSSPWQPFKTFSEIIQISLSEWCKSSWYDCKGSLSLLFTSTWA